MTYMFGLKKVGIIKNFNELKLLVLGIRFRDIFLVFENVYLLTKCKCTT